MTIGAPDVRTVEDISTLLLVERLGVSLTDGALRRAAMDSGDQRRTQPNTSGEVGAAMSVRLLIISLIWLAASGPPSSRRAIVSNGLPTTALT